MATLNYVLAHINKAMDSECPWPLVKINVNCIDKTKPNGMLLDHAC